MQIDPVSTFKIPEGSQISSRDQAATQADFLQMLTTQLRAQDPLSPLEPQEFASQLATFSQLQELENINSTLQASLDMNLVLAQSINNNMASTMIGKTVRAELNTVTVGSAGDTAFHYNLPEAATEISIDVLDADGNIVRTLDVPAQSSGDVSTAWDGRDSSGVRVPEGVYSFQVHAANADGDTMIVDNYIEGRVTAVNYSDGYVTLTVNGVEVLLGQVISILDEQAKKA